MKRQTNQANTKLVIHISLVLVLGLALALALTFWLPVVSKSVEPVAGKSMPGMTDMEKRPMVALSGQPGQPK